MEEDDDIAHFVRQRRNLILISLFLIFYKVGHLSINKLEFLGNEAEIHNSGIITFALIFFFIYYIWRYYTACREIGGLSKFSFSVSDWVEEWYSAKAKNNVEKDAVRVTETPQLMSRGNGQLSFNVPFINDKDSNFQLDNYVNVKFKISWLKKLGGLFNAIIHTSTFSEYILPYLLSLWAMAEICGLKVTEFVIHLFAHG